MSDTESRVVRFCSDLITFDTTNYGNGCARGEADIAEYIANRLQSAGYAPTVLGPTSSSPRESGIGGTAARSSVVVRVPGLDRTLPALLVHAHLDVVPAEPSQWSLPPFEGRIADGYIWGRGAVDMKDMVASTLATLLNWAESGTVPRRDIVVAFVADEEDRGDWGAFWLARHHPELFDGVQAAIGESGGGAQILEHANGSVVRLYPVAAAERGTLHMRLSAVGTSGHGSRPNPDNAVKSLISVVNGIMNHRWPVVLTPAVRAYLEQANAALGNDIDLGSEAGVEQAVAALGEAGRLAETTIRCSATPTVLSAGYKVNVIPGVAAAELDVRALPGTESEVTEVIDSYLAEGVTRESLSFQPACSAPIESEWFDAIKSSLIRHDPQAVVVPFCLGGGTDAKAFQLLGIHCYGFSPLGADPDGRTIDGVHGIDERVPVASLISGQKILQDFLESV